MLVSNSGIIGIARGYARNLLTQAGENSDLFPSIVFGTGRSALPSDSSRKGEKTKVIKKAQADAKSTFRIPKEITKLSI
jgi:hypothetical protein